MKVLLLNGSPHAKGCTNRALLEVESVLREEGIETELIHVGTKVKTGCMGCGKCFELGKCVFDDDIVNEIAQKFSEADGLVVGSPVHYASPSGSIVSLLDRLFYSSRFDKSLKVGAGVVSCRRGGSSAAFDVLNKYFTISGMPIAGSQYWNSVHGFTAEDVERDAEGLQTMRTMGRQMAFLVKAIDLGKKQLGAPKKEDEHCFTSFHTINMDR